MADSANPEVYEPQVFTYSDGSTSTWTRDGERYFKDGVEVLPAKDQAGQMVDAWGQYFRDYHRHIHKWQPIPGTQQMTHVMRAWGPPPQRGS